MLMESKDQLRVSTTDVVMELEQDGRTRLVLPGGQSFRIALEAHDSIAAGLEIPRSYYHRMLEEAPDLLVVNVNRWLHTRRVDKVAVTTGDTITEWRPWRRARIVGGVA